ncbi:hypothetical protein P8C59_006553 [Phyllachora maydis]|uniref:Small-subunit processome Utp12 domain-containing protein n=1 Tax=Phyllachora maydis TaxID=1825666 RepID=A0AAD9MDC1_9PEZI|nr:hypothetical protein P8C59_006553 [Phyllachora maydis]
MKTDFKFSNLLGTVYSQGNLLFNPEGTHLFSPVGNRVTVFDLVDNKCFTLPFAHRKNVATLGLTPQGNILLSVDEDGQAILTNIPRRVALYHFSFRSAVTALAFSPSGRYFAAGLGRRIDVWHVPSTPDTNADGQVDFAPFVRHYTSTRHFDEIRHVEWSSDSRFFLSASKDLTARIWSLNPEEGFTPTVLAGHRQGVVGAWFSKDQETIYTVSRDGAVFDWQYTGQLPREGEDEDEMRDSDDSDVRWRIVNRHYFMQNNATLRCAAYHAESNLLVAGFSNGLFGLYEMPDFNMIHTLSISQNEIGFVTINKSGEWLAFGASRLGQLLVWEWQSESYILKQQAHFDSINALVYSPDGQRIVTCADDGKIKIAVSTLDGQISFWSVSEGEQVSGVDGRRDVSGGRKITDRRTAATVSGTKAFRTIHYSTDGSCLLAGGNSKYICLYSVTTMVLLKKYTVSVNLSLSGTQEFLSSSKLTEAGPAGLIDVQGDASDPEDRVDQSLPGSKRGDPSARKTWPEVRVSGVSFSPTGTAFCAASTEGLLIYSLDDTLQFDPFDLHMEITPASTLAVLEQEKAYLKALVMAFRLNEAGLIKRVFQAIPFTEISVVMEQFPTAHVARLLRFVAAQAEESPHMEFCLRWVKALVDKHGPWLMKNRGKVDVELRVVARAVTRMSDDIRRLADENVYMVDYLLGQAGEGGVSKGSKGACESTTGTLSEDTRGFKGLSAGEPRGPDGDEMAQGSDGDSEWAGFD